MRIETEGARLIVVRETESPADGRWYDLSAIVGADLFVDPSPAAVNVELRSTLRYERREDGMSARVYVPADKEDR